MPAIVLCTINAKWIHPSLALRLLKANLPVHLRKSGENSIVLEFALRQSLAEKITAILLEKPGILALSVSIWNHEATLELLAALEAALNPGDKPVIILGGPELLFLSPKADIFKFADYVIRGEGEVVFSELCQAVMDEPVIAKKVYGKFIESRDVDLKCINSAYELYTSEDLEHKLIYVESSRGCLFNCAFCQSAASALIREFPLEKFLDNLDRLLQRMQLSRRKQQTIKFLDRSFNVRPERAVKILEFCLLKTRETEKNSFQFHFEMVPLVFPGELKDILILFPPETLRLEIGIQSLNKKTCALINRTSNPKKELGILRYLRKKTNALLHVDLIAGLPGEGFESFGKGFDRLWITLSSADNSAPFEIQPGILKCLPGTLIHNMAESGIFPAVYNKKAPYEVISTDCLCTSSMEKIKNFARFWEQIVNRRPFPELLALIVPSGKPVFNSFMDLSQKLLDKFGRNWGIPRKELEETIIKIIDPE